MIRQWVVPTENDISEPPDAEMATIHARRRARLDEIKRHNKLKTDEALSEHLGLAATYLWQLKKRKPPKPIGEVLARKIEQRLGKHRYWMDGVDEMCMLSREEFQLVQIHRTLPPDRQQLLLSTARQFRGNPVTREPSEGATVLSVHEDPPPFKANGTD